MKKKIAYILVTVAIAVVTFLIGRNRDIEPEPHLTAQETIEAACGILHTGK